MDAVADSEVEIHDSDTDVCVSNASSSRYHHTLNMSDRRWRLTTNLVPQNNCSEIQLDIDMQRFFAGLKKVSAISLFVWQDRVHAAMGATAGYNSRGGANVKYERWIRRVNCRDGMMV